MDYKKILAIFSCLVFLGFGKLHSQITEIKYNNFGNKCVFHPSSDQFIINSKTEFNEISDCNLLRYDFNKYTIIGVQGYSPGHFEPAVDIRIFQNDYDKKIVVEVTLSGGKLCEGCRVNKPFYRRVIYTDKLNSDYLIEFKYIKIDG
jgi:hypothetical protein